VEGGLLALAAVASVLGWYLLTGTPPLPSSPAVKRAMLAALPVKLEGTVYDLGSGWGGMAFALARRYPGCRVTGFEVSPLPWIALPKKWRRLSSAVSLESNSRCAGSPSGRMARNRTLWP